jgi:hypothetical protein
LVNKEICIKRSTTFVAAIDMVKIPEIDVSSKPKLFDDKEKRGENVGRKLSESKNALPVEQYRKKMLIL